MIIFELVCCSSSKSLELENHRIKYVVFSAITGGWLAADGVSRLIDSSAVLSDVAYQSIQNGGTAALKGMDAGSQTLMFIIWAAVVVIGGLNQLSMRWGLMCYNRVGAHAQLGPVEEQLPELPTGATLPAQTLTERVCVSSVRTALRLCPAARHSARSVAKPCRRKTRTQT